MNRLASLVAGTAMAILLPSAVVAQTQTTNTRSAAARAQAAMNDSLIRVRIAAQVKVSGMTPDQIRARLQAQGYSNDVINQIVGGSAADSVAALTPDVFEALRSLGIMDSTRLDSIRVPFLTRLVNRQSADSALLDQIEGALQNDSVRQAILRVLSSPAARRRDADSGFVMFGRELFDRNARMPSGASTGLAGLSGLTPFDPLMTGPLPPEYRIGPGDEFGLALSGEVEKTMPLIVTRGGTLIVPQVGEIAVNNLTFEQLRSMLATRLSSVFSGIASGRVHLSLVPTRVGTNQVFVLGDVRNPNAYPISRLGTVLTALFAAGGPSDRGNVRAIQVKRNNVVIATLDLYEYLLTGSSRDDIRLNNGDVVFVQAGDSRVRVTGAVVRPATYQLKEGESLADVIRMAGGFRPEADRRKVQIERIVPPNRRTQSGSDAEVIDVTSSQLTTGFGPTTQPMQAGDVIHVFSIAPRVVNRIEVSGNVWSPSPISFTPEMHLSDALARAGGIKPDTYLEAVQISRLQSDSTRRMLRVGLRANGSPADDIELQPNDMIRVFSLTEFRTQRYVSIGGAVKAPGTVLYQEGMTVRDLIMLAGGLDESALLTEAEIARLPESRAEGVTASTVRISLDSTYLLERGPDGKYVGPPGVPASATRAPEIPLKPYDAVSILRQPDFDYQRTVSIAGRVKYAGTYSLKSKTERLSDLIQRAGGLSSDAYPAGISFIRQRERIGRIGIDLPAVLKNPSDIDNILLVDGDSIFIPPYNAIVTVRGAVNSPASAVAYVRGADINYYVRAAGGGTPNSDEDAAYVLQPNGKVESKRRHALFFRTSPEPAAGSVVHVPLKDPNKRPTDWVGLTQTSLSLLASLVTVTVLIRSQAK